MKQCVTLTEAIRFLRAKRSNEVERCPRQGERTVKLLCASILLLVAMRTALADWGLDLIRFQCIPEIGALHIDTYAVANPDQYGFFEYLVKEEEVYQKKVQEFERRHHMYLAGRDRQFQCTLGTIALRVTI